MLICVSTGNPRNKVALRPGHSLMDWIRLGNSGKDLTGVGGIPRDVPGSELAKHNRREDAWLAIKGESRFSGADRAPLMCDRFANTRTQPQRLAQILNHEAPA
jgi:hypothetical protein